jgi:hypothetical protein
VDRHLPRWCGRRQRTAALIELFNESIEMNEQTDRKLLKMKDFLAEEREEGGANVEMKDPDAHYRVFGWPFKFRSKNPDKDSWQLFHVV